MHENNEFVLHEKIAEGLKQKSTFSGHQYISSTSLRISKLDLNSSYPDLKIKNAAFIKFAHRAVHSEKTGLRVGYGHSEILIEPVTLDCINTKAMVCCGAHKSGFLFAPLLGEKIRAIAKY